MHRICSTLAHAGYQVTLVGRELHNSKKLEQKVFHQHRIKCYFNKGFSFYLEYNLRLLVYLAGKKMDGICAIDLDTILPCLCISVLKKIPRVYDAHEYFTELKEVRTRKLVRGIWNGVEKLAVPFFHNGYTVSQGLADAFTNKYQLHYEVIRNMPVLQKDPLPDQKDNYLYYQGAVNEARGFEFLIPAMKNIPYQLIICGDGNFMKQLKALIKQNDVEDRVLLKGMLPPDELFPLAARARLGMGLAEKEGLNQFMALPNKFFDYIHAGLPQIAMNFPEYMHVNQQYRVAVLLNDLKIETIAETINTVMQDDQLLETLQMNCLKAREVYNWNAEEEKLVSFYNRIFHA